MYRTLLVLLIATGLSYSTFGQDTLPNISVTKLGRKVLISWVNPYPNATNINIQRSSDSLKNFTTIGSVINVDAVTNGFVDTKEFLPSDQFYRLFISISGGSYIFTPSFRPSEEILDVKIVIDSPKVLEPEVPRVVVKKPVGRLYFVPSKHIYLGKDNNVIISLKDAEKKNYSIRFFEDDGTFLFEINKISKPFLILDKVNFAHSGLFKFELFNNREIVEKHKFYIPRDGRAMPALDVNGYEF